MAKKRSPTAALACFAERCVPAHILQVNQGMNIDPTATIRLEGRDLQRNPPDLATPVQLYARSERSEATLIYGGYVTSMEPSGKDRWILRASGMATFAETKIKYLATAAGMAPEQLVFLMARSAGLPPERIHIEDAPTRRTRFMVVMPVEGLTGVTALQAGPVSFTSNPEILAPFEGLGGDDLGVVSTDVVDKVQG